MGIRVITNNVPRDLVDAFNLPESERTEFDHINWAAVENGEFSPQFFRYKGDWYCLDDFTATPQKSLTPEFVGWAGYLSDSAFSGILLRWPDSEYDSVVVARFYSVDS